MTSSFDRCAATPTCDTRPRLSLLICCGFAFSFAVLLTYTSALVGVNAFLNLTNLLTCSVLAADPVWHHGLLPAGRGAGLYGPQRQRQDQPSDHHRRPRAEVGTAPPPRNLPCVSVASWCSSELCGGVPEAAPSCDCAAPIVILCAVSILNEQP